MILLAINTTIITAGIVVFLIVTLILVGMLLFAKAKLTAKGDVQVSINNGERVITTEPGSSLLSTLGAQKYSCLRLAEEKVPAVCVNARFYPEQEAFCRQKPVFLLQTATRRLASGLSGKSEGKHRNAYT